MDIFRRFDILGLDWYYNPEFIGNKNLNLEIVVFLPDLKIVWIYLVQELIKNNYIIELYDSNKNKKICIFNPKKPLEKIEISIKNKYDSSVLPLFFHYPKGYY